MPGPPLTNESAIARLVAHGVTVGIGIEEVWSARNARFDVGWVRTGVLFWGRRACADCVD